MEVLASLEVIGRSCSSSGRASWHRACGSDVRRTSIKKKGPYNLKIRFLGMAYMS